MLFGIESPDVKTSGFLGDMIDEYKHLDKGDPLRVELEIPVVAKLVVSRNYGASRMLSAMVHELRAKAEKSKYKEGSPLADAIECALEEGLYY